MPTDSFLPSSVQHDHNAPQPLQQSGFTDRLASPLDVSLLSLLSGRSEDILGVLRAISLYNYPEIEADIYSDKVAPHHPMLETHTSLPTSLQAQWSNESGDLDATIPSRTSISGSGLNSGPEPLWDSFDTHLDDTSRELPLAPVNAHETLPGEHCVLPVDGVPLRPSPARMYVMLSWSTGDVPSACERGTGYATQKIPSLSARLEGFEAGLGFSSTRSKEMKPHERTRAYQEALEDYARELTALMTSMGFINLPEMRLVKPSHRSTSLSKSSLEIILAHLAQSAKRKYREVVAEETKFMGSVLYIEPSRDDTKYAISYCEEVSEDSDSSNDM